MDGKDVFLLTGPGKMDSFMEYYELWPLPHIKHKN